MKDCTKSQTCLTGIHSQNKWFSVSFSVWHIWQRLLYDCLNNAILLPVYITLCKYFHWNCFALSEAMDECMFVQYLFKSWWFWSVMLSRVFHFCSHPWCRGNFKLIPTISFNFNRAYSIRVWSLFHMCSVCLDRVYVCDSAAALETPVLRM